MGNLSTGTARGTVRRKCLGEKCPVDFPDPHAGLQVSTCSGYDLRHPR